MLGVVNELEKVGKVVKKRSIFYTKFVFRKLILRELISTAWQVKCLKNISLDSVHSARSCQANLGVQSCPVRKLICPALGDEADLNRK